MLTQDEKLAMMSTADIIRRESRLYLDRYKQSEGSQAKDKQIEGFKNYEKHKELERIANELDIISFGNL